MTLLIAPGPSALELVRRCLTAGYDRMRFFAADLERFGPLVRYPAPGRSVFLVADPQHARQVLDRRADRYRRSPFLARLGRLFGGGLITAERPEWQEQRRVIQPALLGERLRAAARTVGEEAFELAGRWTSAGAHTREVSGELRDVTLRIIVRQLFGVVPGAWHDRLARALADTREEVHRRIEAPIAWPEWLPLPSHRRLASAVNRLDRLLEEVSSLRRSRGGDDLLTHLLASLSPEQARDELVTLLQAGHLSSAVGLTWALALVAHHPEVQDSAAAEACRVATSGPLGAEHMGALPLVGQVVDETLRLYPPVWLIDRTCATDDELDGYQVPTGALVLVSPYFVHRRIDDWPDPARFDPARFAAPPRPGTYLPFGAGPRACVGASLARTELTLLLATLLARHRFDPAAPFPEPRAALLIAPRAEVPLRISPRPS